jgi:PQ loop repeat
MTDALTYAPIAATAFAVPQFLPQIRKLLATGDAAGVSAAWAILTCLNNAAWIAYFALEHYWTALIPSISATTLAGTLAILLTARNRLKARTAISIAIWGTMLVAAYLILGRTGLGALLTAAFAVQVAPSLWTAYRTGRPTGIAAGTWLLILGELSCWLAFGLDKSDPRLITLGLTGVTASALMLARIRRTTLKASMTLKASTSPARSPAAAPPGGRRR